MIDLKPFCASEPDRHYLLNPFSRGAFSYATNGHIAVRVPRRPDVSENKDAPDVDKVFPNPPDAAFRTLTNPGLPQEGWEPCAECFGSGHEHPCESCVCPCEWCAAKGLLSTDACVQLRIAGVPFALKYARMILALPAIEWAVPSAIEGPTKFRFDGGDGVLMPLKDNLTSGWRDLGIDLAPLAGPVSP